MSGPKLTVGMITDIYRAFVDNSTSCVEEVTLCVNIAIIIIIIIIIIKIIDKNARKSFS